MPHVMPAGPVTGFNHVAVLTADLDRLTAFYRDVFGLEVVVELEDDGMRHALLGVGPESLLHAFEVPGNRHAAERADMFARGHIDHFALTAADADTFEALRARLVEVGATNGEVTEFGVARSVYFRDPDGMSCEVLVAVGDELARRFHDPVSTGA